MRTSPRAAALLVGLLLGSATAHAQRIVVRPGSAVPTLTAAVALATPGATIVVHAGTYAEPTVLVTVPRLTIIGEGWPVFDGQGARELLVVKADSVTVSGLEFRNTGVSQMQDRAAVRVVEASGCRIDGNRFRDALFAIYLQKSEGCVVRGNDIRAAGREETRNGNGVHLWYSPGTRVIDNTIRGQRDGIYFEFSRGSVATGNVSEGNRRYGLHFMFSDSCRYEANVFRENESGVAVMYSKRVRIAGNRFERNQGSAAYGLLLKEITDSEIEGNLFADNSIALHLEGSSRNTVVDNDFVRNGWAVRVLADAQDNRLRRNAFQGNAFDVGTNSRRNYSTFDGNWWDRYRGYDLDRNGRGDLPHAPVRLFALLVEQAPAALILTRSVLVDLLDIAERVVPMLSPETLRDHAPLMRPPRRLP